MNLEEVLKKYYGYDTFRKPQKEIIEQISALHYFQPETCIAVTVNQAPYTMQMKYSKEEEKPRFKKEHSFHIQFLPHKCLCFTCPFHHAPPCFTFSAQQINREGHLLPGLAIPVS